MRDSIHVVGRLNPKERNLVVQNGSWTKEGTVKWKVTKLGFQPLVGTDELEAWNSAGMTEGNAGYTRGSWGLDDDVWEWFGCCCLLRFSKIGV